MRDRERIKGKEEVGSAHIKDGNNTMETKDGEENKASGLKVILASDHAVSALV